MWFNPGERRATASTTGCSGQRALRFQQPCLMSQAGCRILCTTNQFGKIEKATKCSRKVLTQDHVAVGVAVTRRAKIRNLCRLRVTWNAEMALKFP